MVVCLYEKGVLIISLSNGFLYSGTHIAKVKYGNADDDTVDRNQQAGDRHYCQIKKKQKSMIQESIRELLR